MTQTSATRTISAERINTFLAQVYLVMALGLVVTALVSDRVAAILLPANAVPEASEMSPSTA